MKFDPSVDIDRFQILAVIGSLIFLALIVYLVRKKKLREDYSLLWLFFGGIFYCFPFGEKVLSIFLKLLELHMLRQQYL